MGYMVSNTPIKRKVQVNSHGPAKVDTFTKDSGGSLKGVLNKTPKHKKRATAKRG